MNKQLCTHHEGWIWSILEGRAVAVSFVITEVIQFEFLKALKYGCYSAL